MSVSKIRVLILTLSLLTLFGGGCFCYAQEYRATVSGEVRDPSGKVVPDAIVKAVEKATHVISTAHTNSDGTYVLNYLLPGEYRLTIEAPGFKRKVYPNVTLETAQKLNLNVMLAVGSVHQEVTVTAAPGLLSTAVASNGNVVTEAQAENTPSSGRQTWMNVSFAQGVRNLGTDPFDLTDRNNGNAFSVDGAPKYTNAFYVDGAPVSSSGNWQFSPSEDAVKEVQVSSNPYDTEYGEAAGGFFNLSLKSGTNKYHGDFYDYFGNEALNSNYWQSNLHGIRKGLNIRNTYGGVFGGPIRRNKTFFFGSFEGFRQDYPIPAVETVPTPAMRNGDFAGTGYTIYNPLSVHCVKTTSSGCSQYGRDPFPGDTIPASQMSAFGQDVMNFYPLPSTSGALSNFATPGPRTFGYKQYLGRVDQNFSQNTRLYAVFGLQKNTNHSPGNGLLASDPATTAAYNTGTDLMSILDLTHTISPSLVSDFKLSFLRFSSFGIHGSAIGQNFTANKIGLTMPDVPTTTHLNLVPEIAVNSFMTLFNNTENGSVTNLWNFAATFSQVKGHQILHYGGVFRDIQTGGSGIPGQPNGTFTFNGQWTRENPLSGGTTPGQHLADMLMGYPSGGDVQWNSNEFVTYHTYGFFAQDDYQVLRNLTVNVGVRWDIYGSPWERYNRINGGFCFTCTNPYSSQVNFTQYPNLPNPLTGELTYAGVNGTPRRPFNVQLTNIQPRFGIAYAIRPWMVFRAGYGMFDNYGQNGTTSSGFDQQSNYIISPDGGVDPSTAFLSGTPFPNGAAQPSGANQPQAVGVTYDSPTRRVLSAQHWSAGFQWRLPDRMMLDMEYDGEHAHAIAVNQSWNVINQSLRAQCQTNSAICDSRVSNPFYGIVPPQFSMGANPTLDAYQLQTPWPIFPNVNQSDDPIGYANYNALQVRVQRKIHTLNFIFNYVYSNWMYADHYLNNGTYRNSNLWYGVSSIDRRNYLDSDVLYPLPFGQGGIIDRKAHGWQSGLLSHWVLDWVTDYGSGVPVPIPTADFYGPGCTSYLSPDGQSRAHWFNNNVSCYHSLQQWEMATNPSYMGALREPSAVYTDGALQKRFKLPREGMSLQARIEALNLFNHPVFGGPNTNFKEAPSCSGIVCTGFGTLPSTQQNAPRAVIVSLKVFF